MDAIAAVAWAEIDRTGTRRFREALLRSELGVVSLLARAAEADGVGPEVATAYAIGLADATDRVRAAQQVEVVWTGPSSAAVPVRATSAALADVIHAAQRELVLVTYSARYHEPIHEALRAAVQRGVRVDVVVETLSGAGSALSGQEPAAAFAGVAGVALWHWPKAQRTEQRAKLHAKVAIADGTVMLVSSANLTQSGVLDSLEAGLLVRGGVAPRRSLEHLRQLQSAGVLVRL